MTQHKNVVGEEKLNIGKKGEVCEWAASIYAVIIKKKKVHSQRKKVSFIGEIFLVSSQDALRPNSLDKCLLCSSPSNFINLRWLTLTNRS